MDQTFFIKRQKEDILLVQVYVDEIIFGSTKKELCTEFEKLMHDNQDKYVDEILRKFKYADAKPASTPMVNEKALLKDSDVKRIFIYLKGQPKLGLWYPKDSSFDLVAYTDSDYVGSSLDRKSTSEGCQFLGCKLISWQCKKQTVVPTSSTEAEYEAAASCCGQVLWIQNQLLDYGKARTRTRRMGIRIPQSKVPSSVADKAITKEMHDGLKRATTPASSLEAEHGSGNISKTQTKATPSGPSSLRTSSEGGPGCHVTMRGSHVQAKPERRRSLKEGKSLKRPAEEELGQEQQKKQKVNEDLSQERLQQMMVIIPEQGIHVEALQTKHLIIDWEIYTEGTRQYWKIIRVGNITEVHQFFIDMIKAFDRENLVKLWSLVKERFISSNPTKDKEIALWVELKRLFELDEDDELWKLESF
nr:hypothetical protein [Tanacetum cinerariifolium]